MKTQEERLDYLIDALKKESEQYRDYEVPDDTEEKRRLLRSLMNVRMPGEISPELLEIQDAYLKSRAEEKGIVQLSEIPLIRDRLSVWQGDITRLAVDVIVNAANSQMLGCFIPMHACIDNCIHTFAGMQLRNACNRQMEAIRAKLGENYEQPTGIPMLTDAYNLPAKKIVHVVGPIVEDELTEKHKEQLALCYKNTLMLCERKGLKSIAFCCISTGVFRFPNRDAAEIAVKTVKEYLEEHDGINRVIFNVFKDEDHEIYEALV